MRRNGASDGRERGIPSSLSPPLHTAEKVCRGFLPCATAAEHVTTEERRPENQQDSSSDEKQDGEDGHDGHGEGVNMAGLTPACADARPSRLCPLK